MKLFLYRKDLKPEHHDVSCEDVTFNMFRKDVQKTIIAVNEAAVDSLFQDDDEKASTKLIALS